MKKQLAICLLAYLLTSIPAWAYDFELNGVYYNITDANAKTVEVTYVENGIGNSDFYYGAITIPKRVSKENVTYDVTSIGEAAFDGCSGLTSITIPNSVTSIANNAFRGCSGLTSITIPNSVTSIANNAFRGCSGLTSITIPNSVTSIGDSAFSGCIGLTSIHISDLAWWCNTDFYSSGLLNNVHHLYLGDQEITNLVIPEGVTNISSDTFRNCAYITSVTIPNSVTSIGGWAFYGCSSLTSITIPNSVTSISIYAFQNCSSLTSIHISDLAWWCNTDFSSSYLSDNVHHLYLGDQEITNLVIPEGVTTISSTTFRNCAYITSVTIPNSVTSIGGGAFSGCSALTSVTIPNSVTSIGGSAFQNCSALTSVTIPNSVTSIGCLAFYGTAWYNTWYNNQPDGLVYAGKVAYEYKGTMPNNTDIVLEEGTLGIADFAFYGCSGLTSITIGNSVTNIGSRAFSGCRGLTSITIGNSVTNIGSGAFSGCRGLTSITIGNSVTNIGSSAFDGCSGLTSITIPNSVTSIGRDAFDGCSGLTSITIPNSVTSIGASAFNECSGLTSIHISDLAWWCNTDFFSSALVNHVHHLYLGDQEITNLVIPEGVTNIRYNAFWNCTYITSVTIPNSMTSIGNWAFYGCSSLTSITIPNSVTSIGEYAFEGCNALSSVIVGAATPLNITSYTFSNRANATLYIPIGSKAAYQTADYWKEFGEIVELGELYSIDHTANRGAEFDLPILMNNGNEAITAFQFDVELPEGMTLLSAKLSDRKADQGNPVPTLQSDGSYRLATFSTTGSSFSGSEGTLLNLRIKVSTDAALGEQTIALKNIELTTTSKAFELINQSSTITVLDVLTGDASGDGKVSIFDAVQIVNYILGNTPETFVELAADVDGNGKISIFDAVLTVNIILNQGSTNNARMTTVDSEVEPQ